MKTMIRALWPALALLAALGAASAASAHAVLLETDPTDGALLETAPDVMVILFNEPVNPVRAQILDAAGNDITPANAITLDGPALRIALPTDLPVGSYIASYRVVSIDSHPIAGSIVFSVGQVSS
jgi:copper transport protein